MKKIKKYAALLLTALLLTATLTGCAASGSNAGVWIAVIVMVFIAVFAATSGIVYLVLQKILPPEKPAARPRRVREYADFDETPRSYAAPQAVPRADGKSVWVCPRDKSRNTGPYCTVCGCKRPVPPRPASQSEGVGQQRPARAQSAPAASQQAPRRPASPYEAEQSGFARQQFQKPQQPQAPVQRNPAPVQRAPAPQPEEVPEYRGAFARPAKSVPPTPDVTESQPSSLDVEFDSGVDSEFLEAIFREAAQGNDEE